MMRTPRAPGDESLAADIRMTGSHGPGGPGLRVWQRAEAKGQRDRSWWSPPEAREQADHDQQALGAVWTALTRLERRKLGGMGMALRLGGR
jgi:hypothetical protein